MTPTYEDVVVFTGRHDLDPTTVLAHLSTVEHMVRAYTRGRGFDSLGQASDDVAAVIVAATARLIANPEHTVTTDVGSFSIRHGSFSGWTLPELAILHRYRRRAL